MYDLNDRNNKKALMLLTSRPLLLKENLLSITRRPSQQPALARDAH